MSVAARHETANSEGCSQQVREDLFLRTEQVFEQYDSSVTPIGSVADGKADEFSDLDVWVSVPDDKIEEVLLSRREIYGSVGKVLFSWERPRFAPIGGIHSIVLYDDDRSALPTEVDYYIAPRAQTPRYSSFISRTKRARDFEWQDGEDDPSLDATLNYCALVVLWTAKYLARGRNFDTDWAVTRFKEARGLYPELRDVSTEANLEADTVLRGILDAISERVNPTDMTPYRKIGNAVTLACGIRDEQALHL